MPSTYSPNLRFELIANGEQANTWGTTSNTNIGTLIGESIAGMVEIDVTAADITLVARNGASDEARQMMIVATGTPGAARSIFCPDGDTKVYVVINDSDYALLFSTVSGSGVSVPVGTSKLLYCDSVDVFEAVTAADTLLLGGSPTLALEAATKGYVDGQIAGLPISGLTPNRALISTSGGSFTTSATTSTEVGYLSGVTSAVQTQLNAKAPATSGTAILYGNGSGGFSNVTVGSGLQFSGGTLASTSAGGSVTSVSVTTGNGFSGTVTNPTSTPAIALSTTISGLIKGSAGALAQASPGTDYAPATTGTTAQLLANNGAGGFANISVGSGLSFNGVTLSSSVTSGVTSVNGLTGAVTLNYASVGAPSTGGSGASGTWGISISGNANYANSAGSVAWNNVSSKPSLVYNDNGTYGINITGNAQYSNFATSASSAANASNATYATFLSNDSGSHKLATQTDGNTVYYNPSGVATWSVNNNGEGTFNILYAYAFNNRSTQRSKENIVSYTHGLSDVLKLRPVSFKYKQEAGKPTAPTATQAGFIAEEIDALGLAEYVSYDKDNQPEGLKYSNMVALLTKAIQDLNAKVESLQAEVTALKG